MNVWNIYQQKLIKKEYHFATFLQSSNTNGCHWFLISTQSSRKIDNRYTLAVTVYKQLLNFQYILLKMKTHILSIFLTLLLLTVHCAEDRSPADDDDDDDEDITTLTFLIEYEPEPDNDHIQIGLTVEAKDTSLKSAIQKVTDVVEDIKNLAKTFCAENPEEGEENDCDDVVEVEDFQISADYIRRRKEQQVFQDFVVSHDVTVIVDNTDKIGQLGDKLLKLTNTKIESFDWASDDEEEDDEQEAIEAGKQKAEEMCFHLGMKLNRIVSIEAVEEQQEDNGDDQEGEQQDEQQDGPLVYKFEVECILDAETAARKNAEQEEEDRLEALEEAKQKEKEEEEQKQKKKKKVKAPEKEQADKKKKKK